MGTEHFSCMAEEKRVFQLKPGAVTTSPLTRKQVDNFHHLPKNGRTELWTHGGRRKKTHRYLGTWYVFSLTRWLKLFCPQRVRALS